MRDLLLGEAPKDYDIATSAHPEEVRRLFRRFVPVGIEFGVCRVWEGKFEFEVATFRADAAYADGRHPETVRFTDAREDVLRRDFTINGLLYDVRTGDVLDYVGGRDDLARRVVRAIRDPDERFAEDYLRMLRAVRFAARLDFALDAATEAAIVRHAPSIAGVSAERIRDELLAMLRDGGAPRALRLMHRTELLPQVLPEVAAATADPEIAARLEARLGTLAKGSDEALGLAVLLRDLKPAAATAVLGRLRLPRKLVSNVAATLDDAPTLDSVATWPASRVKRLLRAPHIDLLRGVLRSERTAGVEGAAERLEAVEAGLDRWSAEELSPPPLLTGHDLKDLGYTAGPHFKDMLVALETAQLDGTLATRDDAIAFLQHHYGPPGER